MSIIPELTIHVTNITSIFEFIIKLGNIGWNWKNEKGETEFLPLNDHDNFNWCCKELTSAELFHLTTEKEKANETVGIQLYYHSGKVGITLLANKSSAYSFSLNCNRVKRAEESGIGYTDVNWYIEKIIWELQKQNVQIEFMQYQEF